MATTATLSDRNVSYACASRYCNVFVPLCGFIAFCAILLCFGPFLALGFAMIFLFISLTYQSLKLRHMRQISGDIESPVPAPPKIAPPIDVSCLVIRKIDVEDPVVTCEICLDDLVTGEEVAGSPNKDCIHEFHLDCIHRALKRRTTCPCCRREYLFPAKESETMIDPDAPPNVELGVTIIDPAMEPEPMSIDDEEGTA